MSLALFIAVISHFAEMGWPKIDCPTEHRPFVILPTADVNQFSKDFLFTTSRLFQEILGFSPPGHLGIEQQKLGNCVTPVVRNCVSLANIQRVPLL